MKLYGSIATSPFYGTAQQQWNSPAINGRRSNNMPILSAFCLFLAFGGLLYIRHGSGELATTILLGSLTTIQSSKHGLKKKISYGDTPRFFEHQQVDHFNNDDHRRWTQRYYAERKYWRGPGHPIFLEVGGEGGLDKGMFNPFVERVLSKRFGAYVLHPEHRFYGISQPVSNATNQELVNLLTVEQAMADMVNIANHYRYEKLGCSPDKTSKKYCPLISVGGSYPGLLAVLLRLQGEVDIAYASSAPLKLYEGHSEHSGAYYEALTIAFERASPGCSNAVRNNLVQALAMMRNAPESLETWAAERLNVCPGSISPYILEDQDPAGMLAQELIQLIAMSFADANMIGNYPPSNATRWGVQLCNVFEQAVSPTDSVVEFWKHLEIQDNSTDCFNMKVQLSEGRYATFSGADWSGLGPGLDGTMWDFQCCTQLIPALSFTTKSMFPPREWSYDWLSNHCIRRFGTVGKLGALKDKYGYDDLVGNGATKIIFANGGNDMWLPGSYSHNLSDTLIAVNMPNGAHHTELYALKPKVNVTDDVKQGQDQISAILKKWLTEIV